MDEGVRAALKRARVLVEARGAAIVSVADALTGRGRLGGRDVERIVRESRLGGLDGREVERVVRRLAP